MTRFDSPLNNISIASPCPANWDEMYGDDRKRFCGECKLNVYNLSGMTRDDAERLVTNHEGRLCVRYYRRADGSIITADCPVGWAKIKQRTRLYATAIASLVMALFTGVLFVSLFSKDKSTIGILRSPFPTPTPERLMGAIAMPPKNTNANVVQGTSTGVMTNRQPAETPKTKFEIGKMRVVTGENAGRKDS
jgi:hypothetical protein